MCGCLALVDVWPEAQAATWATEWPVEWKKASGTN